MYLEAYIDKMSNRKCIFVKLKKIKLSTKGMILVHAFLLLDKVGYN
jgi:hypothetical protein